MLCFTLYSRTNFKYKPPPPPGGLYSEGRFNGGFLRYDFGGLIFGGAYFRNLFSQHKPFNEVSDRSHNFLLLPFFFFFYSKGSGLTPQIQLTLAIPSTTTVGSRNFLLLKTFARKLVQEFGVSPSGTRVAMVTYSHDPHLDFRWHEFFNMECTLKAISSIR